tara:strand:- start:10081 stop:10842 length:762 start_codon:yes stop_codon:yes gene_type:complete
MHIYDYSDKEKPVLSKIETVTKIKEMPWMYPSVTTILNILPNHFIDVWKVKTAIELKGKNPDYTYEQITQHMWGLPISPATGEKIASSEFGTAAHDRVEKLVNAMINSKSVDQDPYDDFALPVMEYFDQQDIIPVEAEKLIACHNLKIAGRLDLIAKKEGKLCLFDYKFRDCSEKEKGKFYDKDCYQLAIESFMLKNEKKLDYLPDIYSICICNSMGKVYTKKWSTMMLDRGIFKAHAARDFYFKDNLLINHI